MNAPGDRADVISSDFAAERSPALQLTSPKLMEPVASGRLLVTKDVGGHRELMRDGETGVLFQAGSPDELGQAELGLLGRRSEWPALRAAVRRFLEAERTWRASAVHCHPVFESLALQPE